jgi:hypothetical protein
VDTPAIDVWALLGVLWRVVLLAIPFAAIVWALTRGRRVDPNTLARSKEEIESRHFPPPPPLSFSG